MNRYLTVDDIRRIDVPKQPAISPDGSAVAYVVQTDDLDADRVEQTLWLVPTGGGNPRRLTDGVGDCAPAWSPDGRLLAFLRTTDGRPQIWLLDVGTSEARQLTRRPGGAGAPAFSPDGSRLLFTAPADPPESEGTWAWGAPVVSRRLDYYADGAGVLSAPRQHIHVADVGTGGCEQITAGEWSASGAAWSADGTRIAFSAAMSADADLTRHSAAYTIDLGDPGRVPRPAGPESGSAGPLAWTGDGTRLLVCGHPEGPARFTGLLLVDPADGTARHLTEQMDRQVMYGAPGYPGSTPRVVPQLGTVLFCVREGGYVVPYTMPETGGTPTALLAAPDQNVSSLSVAGTLVAFLGNGPDTFGEIYVLDLTTGTSTQLTNHRERLGDRGPAPRAERTFTISDGTAVTGWVMRDPDATGPQPLLLDIHGGPHNAWNGAAEAVHLYHHELVARGWTVLLLNPRGSDGYGEEFARAVSGRWGTSDTADFLEPLEELVAEGLVDDNRIAVTGYSYGGYMTCYLTSRSDRFAAAVGGGVISDLRSAAGTTDNRRALSTSEWGGAFWADAENYAAMSPITHVADVRTPTLLLHGGADVRCPLDQARQWHTALRELGVQTEIVIYPEASHNMLFNSPPRFRRDYNARVVDWVTRYAG
ncbi:alpha/beta fold hydrolase [Nonomuraea spiralis]|uniref:S9 family peptidase n=1 Tax=Nonomuraea spiralis TaxID=46182 RepID=UPI0037B0A066